MKHTPKHILFITPSLARTGSETLLFNYLCFIAPRYAITVICYAKGDLIGELPKSIKVYALNLGEAKTIFQKITRKFNTHFTLPFLLSKFKKDMWYINTIVLTIPIKYAVKFNVDFVLHVHELKHMYSFLTTQQLNLALNKPKLLIANSQTTKQHLLNAGSTKEISIVNPFIDLEFFNQFRLYPKNVFSTRFCWLMAGSIDKNKNPELFISIARHAHSKNLPYQFTWLYNSVSDAKLFKHIQIQLKELSNTVTFIKTKNYEDYLNEINKTNGLLLTSTYESFSILTLEALAMNLAIVVNKCGGVNEIVNEKTASIVEINSSLEKYIEAMKYEIERVSFLENEKENTVLKFDKTKIIKAWEELMAINLH